MKRKYWVNFGLVCLSLTPVLLIESALRLLGGLPTGYFNFMVSSEGLYTRNYESVFRWGPIPYRVRGNNLGLRGKDQPFEKKEGTFRIAAVGDSVTDGFFVDDEDTYPAKLQAFFELSGKPVEVFNIARGGGSIGHEFALVREVATPLKPDMVILTFVTNDISDIEGKTREELVSKQLRSSAAHQGLTKVLTQTAIGELVGKLSISLKGQRSRENTPIENSQTQLSEKRYDIAGGNEFERNTHVFLERFQKTDGRILGKSFSNSTEELIGNYLFALEKLQQHCQDNGIELLFVYCPSYNQVYDWRAPLTIRDRLRQASSNLGITFFDLTPVFRQKGARSVLHLAPLDFHANPTGNEVMAHALYQFIQSRQMATL